MHSVASQKNDCPSRKTCTHIPQPRKEHLSGVLEAPPYPCLCLIILVELRNLRASERAPLNRPTQRKKTTATHMKHAKTQKKLPKN